MAVGSRMRAALAVVISIGIVGCDRAAVSTAPTPSGSPPSSPAEPTSTPPSSTPGMREGEWVGTPLPDAEHALITSVASDGRGFVAAGVVTDFAASSPSAISPDPSRNPLLDLFRLAIWRSEDGRAWSRVPHEPAFLGHKFSRLVRSDDALLALVIRGVCFPHGCGTLPPNGGTSVFRSADGRGWEHLSDPTGLEDAAIQDALSWRGGLLAVGHLDSETKERDPNDHVSSDDPTDAGVWVSDDSGQSWERVARLARYDSLWRVASIGDRLVAVRRAEGDGVVWSDDGRAWHDVDLTSNEGTSLTDIAARDRVAVSLGNDSDGAATAWRSTDGTSWSRSNLARGVSWCRPVIAEHAGFTTFCGPDTITVWTSRDGREWTRGGRLRGRPEELMAVASGPAGTLAAVRGELGAESEPPVMWFRESR
jgi:hypothetical protein